MKHAYLCIGLIFGLQACTPPREDLNDEDLKLEVPWEDLTTQIEGDWTSGDGEQIALAHPLKTLPAKAAPKVLAEPAVKLQLSDTIPYAGGTLGWVGPAKAFVASTRVVPDDQRLYWVMVKVLSEKYACFMTNKRNRGPQLLVRCSDGRRVLLKRERGADFVQFHAHQYDAAGYEVVVKKHRMIRVEGATALPVALALGEGDQHLGRVAVNQD